MTEQEARAIRNEALAATDYLMMPDYPITPAGRMLAGIYRQKLRDWPQSEGFPDVATLPAPENWDVYKAPALDPELPQPPLVPEYPEPPKPEV